MTTRENEAMLDFIDKICDLAYAVSSFAGTDAVEALLNSAERLRDAIKYIDE